MSVALLVAFGGCDGDESITNFLDDPSLQLRGATLTYDRSQDSIVFEVTTAGDAASVIPPPAGSVDGAPVLGYVFTTDLQPEAVGFGAVEGTVALAITSPDFDDTPLWDEDANARYDDDGAVYHAHWVVLQADDRAPAGLAVAQQTEASILPPTAPMPMYLDSPGFTVQETGASVRAPVPLDRIHREVNLRAEALVAYMQVDASGAMPLLAVHNVVSTWSGALSVGGAADAFRSAWPAARTAVPTSAEPSLDVTAADATYLPALDTYVMTVDVARNAATLHPEAAGQVHGAPVLGYVFVTNIPPAAVGFAGVEGTLVVAVTSHPDFDDTPLWDENMNRNYGDDGAAYHVHWAVLVEDAASPAGLSVPSQTDPTQLPPTAPMPMYLDSPGYHAFASGERLTVMVPAWHLRGVMEFSFDALTAIMRVDASGEAPTLRVVEIFDILSGDLSLPKSVQRSR